MKQSLFEKRTDTGEGIRVREFLRIARQTADETSDPRRMAMLRSRPTARRTLFDAASLRSRRTAEL
jgi:hypothetical protein